MEKADFRSRIDEYPRRPGIYFFTSPARTVLYVGKALSLYDRLNSYFRDDLDRKTHLMVSRAVKISFIETGSEFEALLLEAAYIRKFLPHFNVSLKDDKSYIYVLITRERFPKVFVTRKPRTGSFGSSKDKAGAYYGPFPSAKTTRGILKQLRRIFPFCQQKDLKRACFYSHLGVCKPCPAEIIKLPQNQVQEQTRVYQKNISALKKIFSGKLAWVRQNLEKQMTELARSEQFEEAARTRNQLERLRYITQDRHTQSFMENPNFYFVVQKQATVELRKLLRPYFPRLKPLKKIECYDISTLQGKFSVGSQVVFVDGVPEKGLYRRYRMKTHGKPNDVAMMEEMVTRRLQHAEWSLPDLIVVDGGKPQVAQVVALLNKQKKVIPVSGLAKRLEQIVLLHNSHFVEVALPRTHKALQLLQQLRDESHRFAITYHRLRRSHFDEV